MFLRQVRYTLIRNGVSFGATEVIWLKKVCGASRITDRAGKARRPLRQPDALILCALLVSSPTTKYLRSQHPEPAEVCSFVRSSCSLHTVLSFCATDVSLGALLHTRPSCSYVKARSLLIRHGLLPFVGMSIVDTLCFENRSSAAWGKVRANSSGSKRSAEPKLRGTKISSK